DTSVAADAEAHVTNIRAEPFTEVGDFIHETDARGQHGVGGVFGEFCAASDHDEDGIACADKRRVKIFHHLRGVVIANSDDDAVGLHEVVDGRPFLHELRVGDNVNAVFGFFANDLPHAFGGAARHGGFVHNDFLAIHGTRNLLAGTKEI